MKTGLEELEQYTLTRSQYAKRIGKTTNAVRMMMRHGKLLGEFRFDGSKFLFKDPKRPREYKGQYHGQRPPTRKINRGNHENANYPNEAFRNYNDAKKLAALKSNTATRHILDASLYIYRSLAEALTYRVADILEFSDFKDDFVNKIGKYNVSILNEISELYIYDFGVFIELSPDEEQKAMLEQNIQMALSKGDINLEDAIDVRELKNIKLANQLLKVKRKAKQEQDQQNELQKQAIISQQQVKSQQMAAQVQMQKIELETQSKLKYKQGEMQLEIERNKAEAARKSQLMQQEFQYNLQLRNRDANALANREQSREKAKSERISQQNTEQSKLITQRKNNLPPQNFESNEDSLDGFDLAEFEPR